MNRQPIEVWHSVLTSATLDTISDREITTNVHIRGSSNSNQDGRIKNCSIPRITFNGGSWRNLVIEDSDITQIIVQNLGVAGSIIIKDCTITSIIFEQTPNYKSISFVNNKIDGIEFTNANSISPIQIKKCKIGSALFQMSPAANHLLESIEIAECEIEKFRLLTHIAKLDIHTNSAFGSVDINTLQINQLFVKDSVIKEDFSNADQRSLHGAYFNNVIVKGNLTLNSVGGQILAEALTTLKDFTIAFYNAGSNSITVKGNSKINRFETSSKSPYNHKQLKVQDTTVNEFTLNDSTSDLFLKNLYISSKIHFNNTTLDDGAVFDRVYLNDCILKFTNSSITEARFHSVRWRRDYKIDESTNDPDPVKRIGQFWDIREGYRQLKVVSLSFENKIDAKQFLKHEVRVYYKALTQSLQQKFSLGEFGDWLVLWTNSTFSDFGESWLRPLLFLFGLHCLFFLYLMYDPSVSIGVELGWTDASWDAFKKGLGLYLNLLSPIHDTEISNVYNPKIKTSIFGTLDFFMRLSSAYFIYYFVRATRKFNFNI